MCTKNEKSHKDNHKFCTAFRNPYVFRCCSNRKRLFRILRADNVPYVLKFHSPLHQILSNEVQNILMDIRATFHLIYNDTCFLLFQFWKQKHLYGTLEITDYNCPTKPKVRNGKVLSMIKALKCIKQKKALTKIKWSKLYQLSENSNCLKLGLPIYYNIKKILLSAYIILILR